MGKLDSKASEMVFGVCKQIEGAVMRSKDVANEQKTETLALGLGREKRSEEILRYSRRDAMTIVGDDKSSPPSAPEGGTIVVQTSVAPSGAEGGAASTAFLTMLMSTCWNRTVSR